MIKDNIENCMLYQGMHKDFKKAFDFLKGLDADYQSGKVIIDGDSVYASVNKNYALKEFKSDKWENHKKYIDIQYVIKGKEKFGITDVKKLQQAGGYNEEKDIEFYQGGECYDVISLSEGEFVILFPQDAHLPALRTLDDEYDDRVIVKVKI